MKAAVIGAEERVAKDITFCLQVRYPDITVISTAEGLRGLEVLETEPPDIVLAGCSPPDIKSVDLIKRIRGFSDVALLILSSGQTELERAELLEAGADEYVIMPFSPIEFLAIVSALLRRTMGLGFAPQRRFSIGNLVIDFVAREVFSSGTRVHLTPTEYNLLSELVRNQGSVITSGLLLQKVWGSEYSAEPSFVKKYIHRLRSKIEDDSGNPRFIVNERGVGYKLVKAF